MNRPHIMINVAASADGKIDSYTRKGTSISSAADTVRVDKLRANVDAVLVGGHTLLSEDPKLIVKDSSLRAERIGKGLSENPAKVGIISSISSESNEVATKSPAHLVNPKGKFDYLHNFLSAGPAKVFIYTTDQIPDRIRTQLASGGAIVQVAGHERVDMTEVFQSLYSAGIRSVLVEGGGTLNAELLRLGLVDELTIYIAPKIFGGASSPTLADGPGLIPDEAPVLILLSVDKFDKEGGVLLHYRVTKLN
jgi:2,5-diamino-6-(ribosylamino)-4(3H)-pyrimidinone 5'-phosphate reductase